MTAHETQLNPVYEGEGRAWKHDYNLFARRVLALAEYEPGRIFTPDQQALLDLIIGNKLVAVTSGNGTGKSFVLAFLVIWFLATNANSTVITTSASWELVENVLWKEIRNMLARAAVPIGGDLTLTSLTLDEKWFAIGISTDSPTRFQGKHNGRMLIIGDESTGIDASIFEAAEFSALSPDDRLVFVGNPTDPGSDFYEECYRAHPGKWKTLEMSCLNHPNVTSGRILIPGATNLEQVEKERRDYGEAHPRWESRILGRWPTVGGRMFADWSAERHTYDPSQVALPAFLPRWIAFDWGFAHNSAALFLAYDGRTIYIEDELVINERTAAELGDMVGSMSNPQYLYGNRAPHADVFLAHDMFSRTESFKTRAEQFDEASQLYGLPAGREASRDRIGGFNLITTLLRTDTLRVSQKCVNLISRIPLAMREQKKGVTTEDLNKKDMERKGGDDALDALYKGVMARPLEPDLPAELKIARQVTSVNPHERAMQARKAISGQNQAEQLGYLPRRSGRRGE